MLEDLRMFHGGGENIVDFRIESASQNMARKMVLTYLHFRILNFSINMCFCFFHSKGPLSEHRVHKKSSGSFILPLPEGIIVDKTN
jgi:hypothetical protein